MADLETHLIIAEIYGDTEFTHDEIKNLIAIIVELESALRDSLTYLSLYESCNALDVLARATNALNKLENL
jgi:hypothetical protein